MAQGKTDGRGPGKVGIAAMAVAVALALAAAWVFTPISFLGVQPGEEYRVKVTVGDREMHATMGENTSSQAFKRMLERGPKAVGMRDYAGMEKVGMLWRGLPSNNEQVTTRPGDIVLFMGGSLVVYYAPNSYNFTLMGHIDDVSQQELREILGGGDVKMTFELE